MNLIYELNLTAFVVNVLPPHLLSLISPYYSSLSALSQSKQLDSPSYSSPHVLLKVVKNFASSSSVILRIRSALVFFLVIFFFFSHFFFQCYMSSFILSANISSQFGVKQCFRRNFFFFFLLLGEQYSFSFMILISQPFIVFDLIGI